MVGDLARRDLAQDGAEGAAVPFDVSLPRRLAVAQLRIHAARAARAQES